MLNEEFQQLVLSEQKLTRQYFTAMKSRLGNLEKQLYSIVTEQHKNTVYIKLLLSQTQELTAKYDDIANIIVNKDEFEKVASKIDLINHRILLRMKNKQPTESENVL